LDFSEEMLAIARKRFSQQPLTSFQQGDALALPFEENVFDGAIVSFGLRNVTDIQKAINEMARVVKPCGWVVNLDTCPNPNLPGYWFYFSQVMPRVGRLLSMDPTAYNYLSDSTKHFNNPDQLVSCFQNAGLMNVFKRSMAFGTVSLQAGQKSC
jgi:demethylmenaquinone methyltransferase/2-methoxy-6-polyprenyl-1,4-benzoquinol methylase